MSRKGSSKKRKHSVHWFRKGLRLSDNPALLRAVRKCETWRCIFILDPWFAGSSNVGTNKWRFLLQCLEDLDSSLRKLNSRLFVVRGQPADVLPTLFREWGTTYFTFEEDPEPFGRVRDQNIIAMCKEMGIIVAKEHSHTLYSLDRIIDRNCGKAPLTYKRFQAIIQSMDLPPKPVPTLTLQMLGNASSPISADHDEKYGVPSLEELGFDCENLKPTVWVGGETEALARLERHLERKAWVASFGRPKMTPQSLLASQTGVSPYLRFGCLSTRLFYHALSDLYRKIKKCEPPLSLHGQLLWREFFYCASTKNPNFDKMAGNPICVQIPWDKNDEALAKWANAHTGFPWIDAIMTQLREEGWIHHLARHAVACFLTRGDLWISWEEGMKVFDELLLDADWSVNAGTWLWLSCSSFFQQFFHCYCPVKFGRKADANGDFIRRYIPVLKNFPTRYIHEPWTAPEAVQKSAKCIIGVDYPKPICNHAYVSKLNMDRMKQVYQQLAHYSQTGGGGSQNMPHDLLAQLPKIPKIGGSGGGGQEHGPGGGSIMGPPPDPPEVKHKPDEDDNQLVESRVNSAILQSRQNIDRNQTSALQVGSVITTAGSLVTTGYQHIPAEFRYQAIEQHEDLPARRIQEDGGLPLLSGDMLLPLGDSTLSSPGGGLGYPGGNSAYPLVGGGLTSSTYSYPSVSLASANFSNVIYSQPAVSTTVQFIIPQQPPPVQTSEQQQQQQQPPQLTASFPGPILDYSGGQVGGHVSARSRISSTAVSSLPGGFPDQQRRMVVTVAGTQRIGLPAHRISQISSAAQLSSSLGDSVVYTAADHSGMMMMGRAAPGAVTMAAGAAPGGSTAGPIPNGAAATMNGGGSPLVAGGGGTPHSAAVSATTPSTSGGGVDPRRLVGPVAPGGGGAPGNVELNQNLVSSIPGYEAAIPEDYFSPQPEQK